MTMWTRHSGLDPESPQTFRNDLSLRHIEGILNQVQDDETPVIPDPDPESPQTFRNDLSLRHIKGILNRVQDDGGATACAASLRSDRFGSDATNDKQLSLASRVSHSGPDPESPRSFRPTPDTRRVLCPHNTLPLETIMRYNHLRNGVVGGQHPTLETKTLHREAYQNHSPFTIHHSPKTKGFAHA